MPAIAIVVAHARSRLASAVLCAGAALLLVLASHGAAGANGTQAAEVKRQPVQYRAGSTCAGNSPACQITLTTTPAGSKKRLHVAGLTCQSRVNSGAVVTVQIEGASHDVYEFLRPELSGTLNGERVYFASSSTRYVMQRGDEITVHAVAATDMVNLSCTLVGELVTYE